jgi:hypothetical protein
MFVGELVIDSWGVETEYYRFVADLLAGLGIPLIVGAS